MLGTDLFLILKDFILPTVFQSSDFWESHLCHNKMLPARVIVFLTYCWCIKTIIGIFATVLNTFGLERGCNTIASPLRFLFTHLKLLKLKLLQLIFFFTSTIYYRVMLIKKENLINFFKLNKWTFFWCRMSIFWQVLEKYLSWNSRSFCWHSMCLVSYSLWPCFWKTFTSNKYPKREKS